MPLYELLLLGFELIGTGSYPMSKILELRNKRNTLWEQTKNFLEQRRGENGLVASDAVEQYNKMAQEVKDLGAEIERLEQQTQIRTSSLQVRLIWTNSDHEKSPLSRM